MTEDKPTPSEVPSTTSISQGSLISDLTGQANASNFQRGGGRRANRGGGRGRGRDFGRPHNQQTRGTIKDIITLKCQAELPRRDQFTQFQRDLEQYILKTFDNPDDIVDLVKDLVDPTATIVRQLPRESILIKEIDDLGLDPTDDAQEIKELKKSAKEIHAQNLKLFASRRQTLRMNMMKLYGTIWGQLTPAFQTEVTGIDNYQDKSKKFDCLWLLENVKLLASGIDSKEDIAYRMFPVLNSVFLLRQQPGEPLDSYLKRFSSIIDTAAILKSNIELHQGILDAEKESNPGNTTTQLEKSAKVQGDDLPDECR